MALLEHPSSGLRNSPADRPRSWGPQRASQWGRALLLTLAAWTLMGLPPSANASPSRQATSDQVAALLKPLWVGAMSKMRLGDSVERVTAVGVALLEMHEAAVDQTELQRIIEQVRSHSQKLIRDRVADPSDRDLLPMFSAYLDRVLEAAEDARVHTWTQGRPLTRKDLEPTPPLTGASSLVDEVGAALDQMLEEAKASNPQASNGKKRKGKKGNAKRKLEAPTTSGGRQMSSAGWLQTLVYFHGDATCAALTHVLTTGGDFQEEGATEANRKAIKKTKKKVGHVLAAFGRPWLEKVDREKTKTTGKSVPHYERASFRGKRHAPPERRFH